MKTIRSALLILLASTASAHIVPIDPSTCSFGIQLAAPDASVVAIVEPPVAPPIAGDLVRESYTPDSNSTRSQMQVCPADPDAPSERCALAFRARGFLVNGVAGSIRLPSAFGLRLLANGDLHAAAVPITIAFGSSPPVAVPFELGTAIVLVGNTPVSGMPLVGLDETTAAFRLIGAGMSDQLPAPLGSTPLELQLSCTLTPKPDLDQFAIAPRLIKVRGALTTKKVKLTLVLESEVTMSADFAAVPTVLRLGPEDAALLQSIVTLTAGARGRFASSDGELLVTPLRSRTSRLTKVVLHKSMAPAEPYTSGEGTVALSSGGLMARRGVSLKANRRGTRLVVHER
jgi:hypothetical protein